MKNLHSMYRQGFLSLVFSIGFICGFANVQAAPKENYKVSTQASLKSVLLEEFTGIHCPNCPRGHQTAESLINDFYPYVYAIAVHAGGYAVPRLESEPDYRTIYGDSLVEQLKVTGFPTATINRHTFKGEFIFSTNDWRVRTRLIHQDTAVVNLYIDMQMDIPKRELKVTVEGYYTQTVDVPFHVLHLALLQSNILGPQAGSAEDVYAHKHMLRDMLTGFSGDTVKTPRKGDYFSRSYTYIVPNAYKNIPAKMEDLQLVAFLKQPDDQILNVVGSMHEPLDVPPLKARIGSEGMSKRYAYEYFDLYVKNEGSDTIRELNFDVTINGVTQKVDWSGHIAPFMYQYITIFTEPYTLKDLDNTCKITLKGINKLNFEGNAVDFLFNGALQTTSKIYMEFKTDLWGEENMILVKMLQGEIVYSKGPFPNAQPTVYQDTLLLDENTLYSLEITDASEDGMKLPSAYIKLYKENNSLLYQNYDIVSTGDIVPLNTVLKVDIDKEIEKTTSDRAVFSPTEACYIFIPAQGMVYPKSLSVLNILGQEVFKTSTITNRVMLPHLHKGMYIIKTERENNSKESLKILVP